MKTKLLRGCVVLLAMLALLYMIRTGLVSGSPSSIDLEEFRWKTYPIAVQVNMNQWSRSEYAIAVHDAIESWLIGVGNYSMTYNDTTLSSTGMSFNYYVSNVNATTSYDIIISFVAGEIQSGQGVVGLTTFQWIMPGHDPESPITIDITTYAGTAGSLFVKNVAMHEFGHALGLGHADSMNTDNGPELMYNYTSRSQTVFPSTLDIYGLVRLYDGAYGQTVQLPSTIPYIMLATGTPPLPIFPGPDFFRFIIVSAVIASVLIGGAILILVAIRRHQPKGPDRVELPPPPPEGI